MLFVFVLMFTLAFPFQAVSDDGPKPSIRVDCVNLPDGDVYIDLLIDAAPVADGFRYGHMNRTGKENYDSKIIDILEAYNVDGWRPALVTGTTNPLWGELKRSVSGGKASSRFDYFGVPKRFKVIVVTADGNVTVTNVIDRKTFDCVVDFDYAKKTATEQGLSESKDTAFYGGRIAERYPIMQMSRQALISLISTYLIEGLILLLFGFGLRNNWKPFVFVNLSTQIVLQLSVNAAFYFFGVSVALTAYMVCEAMILIVETALYVSLLKEHSRIRRALYAIVANITSFAGWFLLMML